MTGSVDILLATYNGGRYLPELLASLDAQTFTDFRVLVSDDGSSDETASILRNWAAGQSAQRVRILEFPKRAGSARGNFARLLASSDADHVLFADQDDVWHPTKLARTLEALHHLEALHGIQAPCLAFCDLRVVDQDLTVLHPSLRAFQGLDTTTGLQPQHLLMENVVTGCAMGINAAARRSALPVPEAAIMHDWWLALCCAFAGHIAVLPDALIDYRQHGGNDVGASRWSLSQRLLARLRRPARGPAAPYSDFLAQRLLQADALLRQIGQTLPESQKCLLANFAGLQRQSWIARRSTALKSGFGPVDLRKRLGFLLRL